MPLHALWNFTGLGLQYRLAHLGHLGICSHAIQLRSCVYIFIGAVNMLKYPRCSDPDVDYRAWIRLRCDQWHQLRLPVRLLLQSIRVCIPQLNLE